MKRQRQLSYSLAFARALVHQSVTLAFGKPMPVFVSAVLAS